MKSNNSTAGFTLLEILIALFIFTLLSMMMVGGLHSVINAQSGTEKNAERLRKLQFALLVMSRDIEQTVNRAVLNASGKEEIAFIGAPRGFTFTHTGLANPTGAFARSALQRTRYEWRDDSLWRVTWAVLDQAPQTEPHTRLLLTEVTDARFQYLDKDGRFQDNWPIEGQSRQPLPHAVRIFLSLSPLGKMGGEMSQLYVISIY